MLELRPVRLHASSLRGSAAVSATFFDELSDLLDRLLATVVEPVYVVGDCNIRSDRPDDSAAMQFNDILSC